MKKDNETLGSLIANEGASINWGNPENLNTCEDCKKKIKPIDEFIWVEFAGDNLEYEKQEFLCPSCYNKRREERF